MGDIDMRYVRKSKSMLTPLGSCFGFADPFGFVKGEKMTKLTQNAGERTRGRDTPVGGGDGGYNGFAALTQYDRLRDGRIDNKDPVWNQLRVWRYATGPDGNLLPGAPSTGGELVSLDELGIAFISISENDEFYRRVA